MKIGYYSAQTFTEVGPRQDMAAFFSVISALVVPKHLDVDFTIITDRLYRKYIHRNQADYAKETMQLIQDDFAKINNSSFLWKKFNIDSKSTTLDLKRNNFSDVFFKYFSKFYDSLDCSKYFFEHGDDYTPVRIIRCETPYNLADSERPLEAFDQIKGTPFWLMPDEMANAGSRWFEHPKPKE